MGSGKIVAILFPIMAFVAMGFDHVIANMFFVPAAIFAEPQAGDEPDERLVREPRIVRERSAVR